MSVIEGFAIIVAAALVLGPLSVRPVRQFITCDQDVSHSQESAQTGEPFSLSVTLTLILSAATLVVLVVQAWVYNRQKHLMASQLKATEHAADAAMKQAKIAEESISILERPFLYPTCNHNFDVAIGRSLSLIYTTHTSATFAERPRVDFVLKNYGRSPAIIQYVNVKVDIDADVPSENVAFDLIDPPSERVIISGSASDSICVEMRHTQISQRRFQDIVNGKVYLWFFGIIVFDDLWDRRNELHVCWRWDHSLRVWEPRPGDRNYTSRRVKEIGAEANRVPPHHHKLAS